MPTKISALTASAGVAAEDLIAVVDDPSGTPATQKATVTQLKVRLALMDAVYYRVSDATASPQDGLYMGGRDIVNVRNIQGGYDLAVLGGDKWNLDLGAGTSTSGQRGNLAMNFDVGRGFLIFDGSENELVTVNKTSDNISGDGDMIVYCEMFMRGNSTFWKNSANTVTYFEIGSSGPRYWDSNLEQTTVGGAGGASAPPATPVKYFKVVDSAGVTLVVPGYASS